MVLSFFSFKKGEQQPKNAAKITQTCRLQLLPPAISLSYFSVAQMCVKQERCFSISHVRSRNIMKAFLSHRESELNRPEKRVLIARVKISS